MKYFNVRILSFCKNQTADMKALQDKFRITEQRLSETRNQCQSLRQELKMAQKVSKNLLILYISHSLVVYNYCMHI